MSERLVTTESPFGKEWIIYGQDPGLKTGDLIAFSKTHPVGVSVLPGISLGASFYRDLLAYNHFDFQSMEQELRHGYLPQSLTSVNQQIVKMLPLFMPVAVRSSATDEKGGTGIYESDFFVPTNNEAISLMRLEDAERAVYASYHSVRAKGYKKAGDNMGMGLLIQPVIGRKTGNHFMPALSGVFATDQGKPISRVVIGLGTKAVALGEAIMLTPDATDMDLIYHLFLKLKSADAIDLGGGKVFSIDVTREMTSRAASQMEKLMLVRRIWSNYYMAGQQYYWEFAIDESSELPYIIQSTIEEPPKQVNIELGEPEGTVLCEGWDVVNTGIKTGQGIFVLGVPEYSPTSLYRLGEYNASDRNFLLITPDDALTSSRRDGLGFQHFSNAAAILELKRGLHGGTGGSHFAELCRRDDILFLGVWAEGKGYEELFKKVLGEPIKVDPFASLYDLKFRAANTGTYGRVEILDPPIETEVTVKTRHESNKDLMRHLYDVSSLLDFITKSGRLPKRIHEGLHCGLAGFIDTVMSSELRSTNIADYLNDKDYPPELAKLLYEDLRRIIPWLKANEDRVLADVPDYIDGVVVTAFNNFVFELHQLLKKPSSLGC